MAIHVSSKISIPWYLCLKPSGIIIFFFFGIISHCVQCSFIRLILANVTCSGNPWYSQHSPRKPHFTHALPKLFFPIPRFPAIQHNRFSLFQYSLSLIHWNWLNTVDAFHLLKCSFCDAYSLLISVKHLQFLVLISAKYLNLLCWLQWQTMEHINDRVSHKQPTKVEFDSDVLYINLCLIKHLLLLLFHILVLYFSLI